MVEENGRLETNRCSWWEALMKWCCAVMKVSSDALNSALSVFVWMRMVLFFCTSFNCNQRESAYIILGSVFIHYERKKVAWFVWVRFTAKCVRHGVIDLEDVNIKFKVLIILFERSKWGSNSNSMSIHKRLILKLWGSFPRIHSFKFLSKDPSAHT